MLEQATHSLVRYSGQSKSLDRWLQHRQLLVSGYCHMVTKAQMAALPSLSDVRYWCVELVDYLTAGHFLVFSELVPNAGIEDSDSIFDKSFSSISSTTDDLLKLQETVFSLKKDDGAVLEQNFSALGETLAKRLELEDMLIASSLQQKSTTVSEA